MLTGCYFGYALIGHYTPERYGAIVPGIELPLSVVIAFGLIISSVLASFFYIWLANRTASLANDKPVRGQRE